MCLVQVSCNDWHLVSELSSAYLLEKLVYSMQEAQVEAGPPQDEADSWVASPYAALQPCTIEGEDDARLKGTWQRPWADETEVRPHVLLRVVIVQHLLLSFQHGTQRLLWHKAHYAVTGSGCTTC